MGEKTEATKWVLWALAIMLLVTGVGYLLRPVDKAVERVTLENSFQYQEGKKREIANLQAALAVVDAQIQANTDPEVLKGLRAQRITINAQLIAARGL
jgi:hypothetical protein